MLFPEGRLGGQGRTQNAVRAGSSCSASEKEGGDGDEAEGDGGQGGAESDADRRGQDEQRTAAREDLGQAEAAVPGSTLRNTGWLRAG